MGECILSGQGSKEAAKKTSEEVFEDKVIYGTDDKTAGSSDLETGTIYLVYE